jgi:hypothetical protein
LIKDTKVLDGKLRRLTLKMGYAGSRFGIPQNNLYFPESLPSKGVPRLSVLSKASPRATLLLKGEPSGLISL